MSSSVFDYGATGNGIVDDTNSVQSAINSIFSNGGGNLIFPKGIYKLKEITLRSNITLMGENGSKILTSGQIPYQITFDSNSKNINICNLTFSSPGIDPSLCANNESSVIRDLGGCKNIRVENCSFYDIPTSKGQRYHASILNSENNYFVNNYSEQCGGDTFNFNNGYNVVTGNIIKNCGDGGIAFNNGAQGIISNNLIYKCNLGIGAGPEGTIDNQYHTLTISGNEISSCDMAINMGWFGYKGREGPINATITGNTITKTKRVAIGYWGNPSSQKQKYLNISSNTINYIGTSDYDGTADPNSTGIVLCDASGFVLASNIISNCSNTAVSIKNSIKNTINGNTISDCKNGIIFESYADTIISSNRISFIKNTCLSITTNSSVIGNQFSDCVTGINIQNNSKNYNISNNLFVAGKNSIVTGKNCKGITSNNIIA